MPNPAQWQRNLPPAPTSIEHGEEDIPPGPWARYLLSTTWAKTSIIVRELQSMSPQRELQTREMSAGEIETRLGSLRFVLSALVQVVGYESTTPCSTCQKRLGVWPGCKTLSGFLQGACANCQKNGNRHNCTFHERNARSRSNIQALLDDVQPEGQGTRETTPTIPHKRKRADWNWIPEQSNDRLISPRIEAHRGEDLETMEITRLEPSISESSQIPTFKELWVQLADVEHPPYNWDLHVSMGNLEKLRLNWSQNDVATSVIEGDLSSTDIDALKNALKKLSPNVRAILRDIKSDEDSNAVQDVISYMESLDEIEPEINNMENGPVKEAYTNLYSHFDSIGASKSKPNTVTTTLSESPRLSLEIEEVRIQLLQNFQQKEALTREGASSCRPPGGQSEGYAPCFAQKEVDRQLRTELNSQSPKMISRSRRFSKASRQIQASVE